MHPPAGPGYDGGMNPAKIADPDLRGFAALDGDEPRSVIVELDEEPPRLAPRDITPRPRTPGRRPAADCARAGGDPGAMDRLEAELLALGLASRIMVLTLQDRLIKFEETTRLQRCLPDDLRGRIGELTNGQLISLRFCGDDEVAGLTRSVLDGTLKSRDEIKKQIKTWRPDTQRA